MADPTLPSDDVALERLLVELAASPPAVPAVDNSPWDFLLRQPVATLAALTGRERDAATLFRALVALDDPRVQTADKAGVLTLLGLQPGRYPSAKMILGKKGAAGAAAGQAGGAQLGKPSMFHLIAFPENIYKADNRQHGETSGGEPELQTVNMPAQAFLDGVPMVKA